MPRNALLTTALALVILLFHASPSRAAPLGIHERTEPLRRIDPTSPDTVPGFELNTPVGLVRTIPSLNRIEIIRKGDTEPTPLATTLHPLLPTAIAATSTHLFIADTGNRRILRWSIEADELDRSSAIVLSTPTLRRPVGLATHHNQLFIADSWSDHILVLNEDGQPQRTIGQHGAQPGFLSGPIGLLVHDDLLFVADSRNSRVQAFDPASGEFRYEWGLHVIRPHEADGRLHYPTKLLLSDDGSTIGVTEPWEDRVQWFRRAMPEEKVPQRLPLGADNFVHFGSGVDAYDRLLAVTDPDTHTVRIFDLQLETPVLIGVLGEFGDLPSQFAHPSAVAFLPPHDDRPLRLAVADRGNARIALYAFDWSPDETLRYRPKLATLLRTFDLLALDQQHPPDAAALLATPDDTITLLDAANHTRIRLNHRLRVINSTSLETHPARPALWTSARRDPAARPFFVDRANRRIVTPSANAAPQIIQLDPVILDPVDALFRDNDMLIVDRGRHTIVRCDLEGHALEYIGQPGLAAGHFHKPAAILRLPDKRILVVDRGNHRIQFFNPDWTLAVIDGPRLYTGPARIGQSAPRSTKPPQTTRPIPD